jgi:light-regulated signal transduction histidine kinase (bacteriophytochrome)
MTSDDSAEDGARRETRAERLLTAMHKVFSHDLPNQLVVVSSLVSLLREEEEKLSAEGQDNLRRLDGAAHRAADMVHFLKDMARLAKLAETMEVVRLPSLAREVQAELNQLYPDRRLQQKVHWEVPSVTTGRRSLYRAIVQLLRLGIEQFPHQAMELSLSSRRVAEQVEIAIAIEPVEGPLLSNPPSVRQDRTVPEQRLEFVLARENLALWGGTLAARPAGGRTCQFAIGVPTHLQYG